MSQAYLKNINTKFPPDFKSFDLNHKKYEINDDQILKKTLFSIVSPTAKKNGSHLLFQNYNKAKKTPKSEGKGYFSQFFPQKSVEITEKHVEKTDCIVQITLNSSEKVVFSFLSTDKTSDWLLKKLYEKTDKHFERKVIGFINVSGFFLIDYVLTMQNYRLDNLKNRILIFKPIFNDILFYHPRNKRINMKCFDFMKLIGSGGFSKVFLARNKINGGYHAIKLIDRYFINSNNKEGIILNERNILASINHPFIIKLDYAFKSKKYLVFVMEFCCGGELFYHLRRLKRLSESSARIYFLELCLAIRYLHENNIIYRDIKPENILLDLQGHLKLADFGLAKPNMDKLGMAHSFCGSPEYMAPEMLLKMGHNNSVDLYCLGALLYELVVGMPPFYTKNTNKMFQRILSEEINFPNELQLSDELKELIEGLLIKNPNYRLGSNAGIREILAHPWCRKIDIKNIERKNIEAPIKPNWFDFYFDEVTDEGISKEMIDDKGEAFEELSVRDENEEIFKEFYYERDGELNGKYFINGGFARENREKFKGNTIFVDNTTSKEVSNDKSRRFQIEYKKTNKTILQNFILKQVYAGNNVKKQPILNEKNENNIPLFLKKNSLKDIVKSINPSVIGKIGLNKLKKSDGNNLSNLSNLSASSRRILQNNNRTNTEPSESTTNLLALKMGKNFTQTLKFFEKQMKDKTFPKR